MKEMSLFPHEHRDCIVLIAEDSIINMIVAVNIISKILPNSNITEVTDGKQVVQAFRENRPDIIFMDIQMPEVSGYDASRVIREFEDEIGGHVPIIALTAGTIKGESDRCHDAGMDDYITKPIIEETIYLLLQKWLPEWRKSFCSVTEKKEVKEVHFDRGTLLSNVNGDEEVVDKLADMAIKSLSILLEEIKVSFCENNIEQVKVNVHKMKGAALNIGFIILGNLVLEMEEGIESGSEECVCLLEKMGEELHHLEKDKR
jgi:CheY-like chemotaxis protein/HPt (histidine-containing phosphotransfer) domain-containing protein